MRVLGSYGLRMKSGDRVVLQGHLVACNVSVITWIKFGRAWWWQLRDMMASQTSLAAVALLCLVAAMKGDFVCARMRGSTTGSIRPPNFVVIFMDDVGWGDWGVNWNETTETVNLDRLAGRSMRFTDFHSAASVCTPSRAGLLTGRLGLRTGVVKNFEEGSLYGLPQTEITLAEALRDAGYSTAMIGKWHLGTTQGYHPTYRGFQRYLGVPYSVDMGCTDTVGADHPPLDSCCSDATSQSCANGPGVPLYNSTGPQCSGQPSCNHDIEEQPLNLTTLSDRFAAFAERFIAEQASRPEPFLLYMAMSHMHVPLAHAPEFTNTSKRSERQVFGDTLVEADSDIQRVIAALERHQLDRDTLVLITSDNGPWNQKCQLSGLQGPFEGRYVADTFGGSSGKFSCWEGGHRVPALAYWPGTIQPGVSSALSSTLDVFPTFLSLAGRPLPSDRSYDGMDLTPLLLGRSSHAHSTLFHPDHNGDLSAMRHGSLKVHFRVTQAPPCVANETRPVDAVLDDFPFVLHNQAPLVFDLDKDPAESTPIQVSAEVWSELYRVRGDKLADILSTQRSHVDYARIEDPQHWPCCDVAEPACRCPAPQALDWHLFNTDELGPEF